MSAKLYRLYDESGDLLYIGITGGPIERRIGQHRLAGTGGAEAICEYRVRHFATMREAMVAESVLVAKHNPPHNVRLRTDMPSVGGVNRALRTLRNASGMTLGEAASAAGVSVSYLSRAETGVVSPSSKWVARMITAFGECIATQKARAA